MKHINLLCLFLVFILAACSPTLRIKPGEIPKAELPAKAQKVEAEGYVSTYINEANYKEIKSGAELRRAKNVVERLSRAAGFPAGTFPVHLVDAGKDVNAAAVNGASIIVYRELLRKLPTDAELATILGHEVGHIVGNHYKDQAEEVRRAENVSMGSSLLGAIASVATSAAGYGGASSLAGDITETTTGMVGYGAFVGSFNRTQEYEADHLGLLIMAKAGYNPETAVKFWDRADEIFGSSSEVGAFFSTHPASAQRKKALLEAMPFAVSEYERRTKTGRKS